jgi:class 3 adenylate cyclase/tetratricopeptide (TPR) repeat protein
MQCVHCQHDNQPSAKFCQECGAPLPRGCAACGSALPEKAKFCPECGAPVGAAVPAAAAALAVRAQGTGDAGARDGDRRHAVVLFADLSGYTELVARTDPEEVQALLARLFDATDRVVEAYGGQVLDHAGDGVLAAFGAPVAHGNDAERAVRAALDMHAEAERITDAAGQRLRLHIGIAIGEVVAAVIKGGAKPRFSVTGEAVNLAARLDAIAGPGETLVSQGLHQAVAALADSETLGERTLKGLDAPVPVWRLRGLQPQRAQRLPFVGRATELRQLCGVLDSVLESGHGTAVFVRGEAGIGKSRLVEECRDRARERGWLCHRGQALDFGVGRGQDAISVIVRDILMVADADPGTAPAGIARALQSGLLAAGEEGFAYDLLDLDLPPDLQPLHDEMDAATRMQRGTEVLRSLLVRAASAAPRLVVVEDVHWASPALLRHLGAVGTAVTAAPVVLLMTSRIEGDPLEQTWRSATRAAPLLRIDLAPLRDDEAQALAEALVQASSGFTRECIERAEGNPLFLEQLLRASRESDSTDVPPTIQSLVLARIDRLQARDRAALQAASVIGKRFTLEALRNVTADATYACEQPVAADLMRPDRDAYAFAHALIQEAVYSSILKARKRELHRAAARVLGDRDAALRAEHLDRADDAGAAAAYLEAARHESERLRHEAALRLASRGLELAGEPNVRCALTMLQADLLRDMGRSRDSIDCFRAALSHTQDEAQRVRALTGIAAGHRVTGEIELAMNALDEAQPVAERLGLMRDGSKIHHLRGNLYFAQGRIEQCRSEHQQALDRAQRAGSAECEVQALSGLGDAHYAEGRIVSALPYFRRAIELCEREGWVRLEIANRCMVGHCLWYVNELGRGIAQAQVAADAARRLGLVQGEIFATESLGLFLYEAGREREADEMSRRCVALAEPAGARRFASAAHYVLSMIRLDEGRREAAREALDCALAIVGETGPAFLGAPAQAALARLADSAPERRAALGEGERLLREQCVSHCHLWFYRDALAAVIAAGEWDEALRYAGALERYVSQEPLPWANLIAAGARALASAARYPQSSDALEDLRRIREECARVGLGRALRALDGMQTRVG